jgi:hypothetical protein
VTQFFFLSAGVFTDWQIAYCHCLSDITS